jgi:hypothetical protein
MILLSGPLDLLGEFHHEPVGVGQMQRAVTPGAIGWAGEDLGTGRPEPGRLAIDVADEEGDLSTGSASTRVPSDELRQLRALEEPELRPLGDELGVAAVLELELQADQSESS